MKALIFVLFILLSIGPLDGFKVVQYSGRKRFAGEGIFSHPWPSLEATDIFSGSGLNCWKIATKPFFYRAGCQVSTDFPPWQNKMVSSRLKSGERATTLWRPKTLVILYLCFRLLRRILGMVRFFTTEQVPFHTYQLPSEKVLLWWWGVYHLKSSRRKSCCSCSGSLRNRLHACVEACASMHLILVKMSDDQRKIYNLKELVSLDVSVETEQNHRLASAIAVSDMATHSGDVLLRASACGGEHPSG